MVKIADSVNSFVVVPGFITTGVTVQISDDTCHVDLDHPEPTVMIEICDRNTVFQLRWNTRRRVGRFLYIARAWKAWNGSRKFRVQCHRVFDDGVIWWREILYETNNGKVTKLMRNHEAIRVVVHNEQE